MDTIKENAIKAIVDTAISSFANGLDIKHTSEVDNPDGVINSKKNNIFIAELGNEFMFYSAFVRSFDSSFGKVLENISNNIAKLSYEVKDEIYGYILPQQQQQIDYMMDSYLRRNKPTVSHYVDFRWITPRDTRSYETSHCTDNFFYDKINDIYYLIELKAGGDLDNKKAKSEKVALLNEYFILKNHLIEKGIANPNIKIFLATAYNKNGEGNTFKNDRVRQFFSNDELLIGKDYWNFVCDDPNGFDIVMCQYKKSAEYIKNALIKVKRLYFGENI
ncbi:MAG: TdeIII family type II restriction endonuclease [Hominimerdicola sp.]